DRIDGRQSRCAFRPAAQAGPETRAFRGSRIRIKAHVIALRRPRRAYRPAINARRGDRYEESSVETAVAGPRGAVTGFEVEFHGATVAIFGPEYSPFSDANISRAAAANAANYC